MDPGSSKRINAYLRDMGICSRRKADELILRGSVEIESGGSKRTATLGDKAEINDKVYINGKLVSGIPEKEYILYYKPRGVVCTSNTREGRTVGQELDLPVMLTYAGRLDKDSEGLLLMTNDGTLIDRMMRARYRHEKEYECTVDRDITREFIKSMSEGIDLDGMVTRPCTVIKLGKRTFRIILTQGINRQIRRMCAALGYNVLSLKRVRIMNLKIKGLKSGQYRRIDRKELAVLKDALGLEAEQ